MTISDTPQLLKNGIRKSKQYNFLAKKILIITDGIKHKICIMSNKSSKQTSCIVIRLNKKSDKLIGSSAACLIF